MSAAAETAPAAAAASRTRRAGITHDVWIALLLMLAAQVSTSALESPFHRMFEGSGGFFQAVARTHLERGLGFTKGQDWVRNADNPYDWAGPEPDEARPYAHHPPGLGLSLALLFRLLEPAPPVARLGTVAMHLSGVLLLLLTVRRFAEPHWPFAALFTGCFAALAPIAGYFGRHVCHEAWVTPGLLLASAAYLPRLERRSDGTRREDLAVCGGVAVAACFGWPGLYLPPLLVCVEALRGRPFGRLSRWLFVSSTLVFLLLVGQIAWAVGLGGLEMLADGARKRVSPGTFDIALVPWIARIASFAREGFTGALLTAAGATVATGTAGALLRLRLGRPATRDPCPPRPHRGIDPSPIAVWIGVWLALGTLHVVAFPSGSFIHPYWLWYLLPGLATAGGIALSWLWRRRTGWRTVPGRLLVLLAIVSFTCEARSRLHAWFDVPRLSTGNPLLDRPLPAPVESLCAWCVLPRLPDPPAGSK